MEKIPTLFMRDPENMSRVTREINPEAAWALESKALIPTLKVDGTNVALEIWDGELAGFYKRRNPSRQEKAQAEAQGLPKPEPTYVRANRDDPSDKHIFAALDAQTVGLGRLPDGFWSAEAFGPKIQGGTSGDHPGLYIFDPRLNGVKGYNWAKPLEHIGQIRLDYDFLARYLAIHEIEGIVFHELYTARMVKIKRRDFGLPWPPSKKGKS